MKGAEGSILDNASILKGVELIHAVISVSVLGVTVVHEDVQILLGVVRNDRKVSSWSLDDVQRFPR